MKTNQLLISTLLVGLLAACGSGGSGSGVTPTPAPAPKPTPAPAASLYYEPANTTAVATPALSGTNFTIKYPDGSSQNLDSASISSGSFSTLSNSTHSLLLGGTRYNGMRYGVWTKNGSTEGGAFVVGTPATSMPMGASGLGTVLNYSGKSAFVNTAGGVQTSDSTSIIVNTNNMTAELLMFGFGGTGAGSLVSNGMKVTGTSFAGTLCNGGASSCTGPFKDGTGTVKGGFYGTNAAYAGGVFSAKDVNGAYLGSGAFGAARE